MRAEAKRNQAGAITPNRDNADFVDYGGNPWMAELLPILGIRLN